jgi:hypothetical protein
MLWVCLWIFGYACTYVCFDATPRMGLGDVLERYVSSTFGVGWSPLFPVPKFTRRYAPEAILKPKIAYTIMKSNG